MNLTGKHVLVTGGSRGLGRAIVDELLREGAKVAFCSRTATEVEKAEVEISSSNAFGVVCDLSDGSQALNFSEQAVARWGRVDAIINNAGVLGPIGPIEDVSWGEWTKTMEINVYGPLHLCRAVIPQFKANRKGKIVNVSGGGATNPMPRFSAYAASKAALVRLTETLAGELSPFHIDVNAIAPGALHTHMMQEVLEAGPGLVGEKYYRKNEKWADGGAVPLEIGATLCAYLVSDQSDGITGRLLSAQWDPWERLHELRDELLPSDIYTLRRIVAEDRGKNWSK